MPLKLYFLKSGNAVKIGYSTNPRGRLHSLQTGCSEPAFFAKIIPGRRADEARFHKRYAEYRLRGEWFDLRGSLARYLERCNAPAPFPEPIVAPPPVVDKGVGYL